MIDVNQSKEIRTRIYKDGYFIYKNFFKKKDLLKIRSYCLNQIQRAKAEDEVIWHPYIGEEDSICFTSNDQTEMTRGYFFPWNDAGFAFSSHINKIEKIKSKIFPEQISKKMSMYSTFTHYEVNKGFLKKHRDQLIDNEDIIHCITPLTQKFHDFEKGGLFIIDKTGKKIDVDGIMGLGDIIFFNGSCEHGVDIIEGGSTGRLQIFSISTNFIKPIESERLITNLSLKKILLIKSKYYIKNILKNAKKN